MKQASEALRSGMVEILPPVFLACKENRFVCLCACASVRLCVCASVRLCICASVHLCSCMSAITFECGELLGQYFLVSPNTSQNLLDKSKVEIHLELLSMMSNSDVLICRKAQ